MFQDFWDEEFAPSDTLGDILGVKPDDTPKSPRHRARFSKSGEEKEEKDDYDISLGDTPDDTPRHIPKDMNVAILEMEQQMVQYGITLPPKPAAPNPKKRTMKHTHNEHRSAGGSASQPRHKKGGDDESEARRRRRNFEYVN